MDEPSILLGSSHRKYRHDPDDTHMEARAIFGEGADNAYLYHIDLDELESRKSITSIWFPRTDYYKIKSVLPVIKLQFSHLQVFHTLKVNLLTFLKRAKPSLLSFL